MYDPKNVEKMQRYTDLIPEGMSAFKAFDAIAHRDGAIPAKYKELIAVAVATTTQCPYCIDVHARAARRTGATAAELAEATLVAAAIRAGGAMTHGTHMFT